MAAKLQHFILVDIACSAQFIMEPRPAPFDNVHCCMRVRACYWKVLNVSEFNRLNIAVALREIFFVEGLLLVMEWSWCSFLKTHWVFELSLRVALYRDIERELLCVEWVYTRLTTVLRVDSSVPRHYISLFCQAFIQAHLDNFVHRWLHHARSLSSAEVNYYSDLGDYSLESVFEGCCSR